MKKAILGKTGLNVNKTGFGALPIQRVDFDEADKILKKAFEGGIDFYDTARFYSDSEEKLGRSLSHVRDSIVIASKSMAKTPEDLERELDTSLKMLKTDHIDIYQLHDARICYRPGDGTGLCEALEKFKKAGKIRHIGITTHRMSVAREAIESGFYETLQYPFNYLASADDIDVYERCVKADMGFICMKAMSGGLVSSAKAAYAFLDQYNGLVPIWGIQRESELDEFLKYSHENVTLTDDLKELIEKDKKELSGNFCRGCGYCMSSCPAGIKIDDCARMSLMIRRAPSQRLLSAENREMMKRIEDCIHCGACSAKCPYGLDTPKLLEENYKDYMNIVSTGKIEPLK
ncbi:aldo/keto reductase [Lachnospiraceae bacterium NSJ-143]|nr:aldo/keto reductase [Lachnospiraceae bacterium NSJ-143]